MPMSAHEATNETTQASEGPEAADVERGDRIEAAAVLLIAAGVLVTALLLTPSPQGFGTHEQLLVIPCAFRWITGLPCPLCGMTTAFTLMARGDVLAALGAHVLGPPLYLATWLLGLNAVVELVRGRSPLSAWLRSVQGARWVLLVVAGGWVVNVVLRLLGH